MAKNKTPFTSDKNFAVDYKTTLDLLGIESPKFETKNTQTALKDFFRADIEPIIGKKLEFDYSKRLGPTKYEDGTPIMESDELQRLSEARSEVMSNRQEDFKIKKFDVDYQNLSEKQKDAILGLAEKAWQRSLGKAGYGQSGAKKNESMVSEEYKRDMGSLFDVVGNIYKERENKSKESLADFIGPKSPPAENPAEPTQQTAQPRRRIIIGADGQVKQIIEQ